MDIEKAKKILILRKEQDCFEQEIFQISFGKEFEIFLAQNKEIILDFIKEKDFPYFLKHEIMKSIEDGEKEIPYLGKEQYKEIFGSVWHQVINLERKRQILKFINENITSIKNCGYLLNTIRNELQNSILLTITKLITDEDRDKDIYEFIDEKDIEKEKDIDINVLNSFNDAKIEFQKKLDSLGITIRTRYLKPSNKDSKNKSLTIEKLLKSCYIPDESKRKNLLDRLDKFKKNTIIGNIKKHRNRRISHNDEATMLGKELPPIKLEELDQAITELYNIFKEVSKAIFNEEYQVEHPDCLHLEYFLNLFKKGKLLELLSEATGRTTNIWRNKVLLHPTLLNYLKSNHPEIKINEQGEFNFIETDKIQREPGC